MTADLIQPQNSCIIKVT